MSTARRGWTLLWSAMALTAVLVVLDFVVQCVVTGELGEAFWRATRAAPFILLAAVLVIVLVRRQLRARQQVADELRRANHALTAIARLTEDELRASEVPPLDRLVTVTAESLGADVCALYRVEAERLELATAVGRFATLLPAEGTVGVGVIGGVAARPVATVIDDIDAWPGPNVELPPGPHSWALAPVRRGALVRGVVLLGSPTFGPESHDTLRVLQVMADRASTWIETSELVESERKSRLAADHIRRQLSMLAQSSIALVAPHDDPDDVLRSIVDVLVPDFADWCAVDAVEKGTVRRVTARHADPALSEEVMAALAADPGWTAVVDRVVAGRQHDLAWGFDEPQTTITGDDHARLMRSLGLVSSAVVPVVVRSEPVGALTCATGPDRRGYRPSDVAALEELASRIGLAIERVQLYGQSVRSARAASASEARLRALVDAAPLAIVELDLAGRITFWNRTAEDLLGVSVDDGRGGVMTSDPRTSALLNRMVTDALGPTSAGAVDELAWRADGTQVALSLASSALRDEDGAVATVLVIATDTSARRLLEEQLLRAQRLEAVGQMAGGVAHDFNNLLAVILGRAELLERVTPPEDPRTRDITAIQSAATRAAGVTSALLTISKGGLVSDERFDAADRISALQETIEDLVPEDITVLVAIAPGEHQVRLSPAQFDQVVLNLAVNARDAIEGTGTIQIAVESEEHDVRLTVTDDGMGMDEATAARCFEPFFSTKATGHGTGLGLATVQSIVTAAGGEATVGSSVGHGTTFIIRIPRAAEPSDAVAPVLPRRERSGHILVVDDEEDLRVLTVDALRAAGFEVQVAANGQEALQLLDDGPLPDLLVTDVVMPRLGGIELAASLRERSPDCPVLFMTGYAGRMTGMDLPGAEVLIKPFGLDQLVAEVRTMLGLPDSDEANLQGSNR